MKSLIKWQGVLIGFLLFQGIAMGSLWAKAPGVWVRLYSFASQQEKDTALELTVPEAYPKQVRQRLNGQEILVQVPLEEYVAQVLAAESLPRFHPEALKAQAIVIRSLASAKPSPHHREGYDFCDSTHCQVFSYRGILPAAVSSAVRETQGLILSYQGKAIAPLYHSTCGGHTSSNGAVFGGEPLPYLSGQSDESYCKASPHQQWRSEISLNQLAAIFPEVKALETLEILQGDAGGRVLVLALSGQNRIKLSAQDFLLRVGRRLGWSTLKSANFVVNSTADTFQFQGQGLGHGVGMCQWGSQGMAKLGKNYREILRHYYPGTKLLRAH